jgi:hypothetical protein
MAKSYIELIGITTKTLPCSHWSQIDANGRFINHIRFVELLGKELKCNSISDWYKICNKDVEKFGGSGLITKYYNHSIKPLLEYVFPNEWFVPWLFTMVPQGYWNSLENLELYLDWLSEKNGYRKIDDLYKLRTEHFKTNNGLGVLKKFKGAIQKILEFVYPEKEWLPFKFNHTVSGSLQDIKTHKQYLLHLEQNLCITSPEEWYDRCTVENIKSAGSPGLLGHYYNSSPTKFIYTMYPDFPWKWYKFTQASHGHWNKKDKVKEWFEDMLKHYNITDMEQVYTLGKTDIKAFYGNGGLQWYKSYVELIVKNISYNWDKTKFVKTGYSKKAVNFINRLISVTDIQIKHKLNNQDGEEKIGRKSVDGFILTDIVNSKFNMSLTVKGIVVEYHGCCYHGCPNCYPNRSEKTFFSNKTYQQQYDYTEKRKQTLTELGYIILEIWECEDDDLVDMLEWFKIKLGIPTAPTPAPTATLDPPPA